MATVYVVTPTSCCWSYAAASSPPAKDATAAGTTGTA